MEKDAAEIEQKEAVKRKTKRTWYGKKKTVVVPDLEQGLPEQRPIMLYAPIYNGLAFGMSVCKCYPSYMRVNIVVLTCWRSLLGQRCQHPLD